MTFDSRDILSTEPTTHTHVKMANSECALVDREDPIAISSSPKLKHSLLIPNLSYKLLSIVNLPRNLIVLFS